MATIPKRPLVRASARLPLTRSLIALSALVFATVIAGAQSLPTLTPTPPATTPALPPTVTATQATTSTTTITRAPSPSEELNTLLMHATFLISGPGIVQGQTTFGTIFVMGVPHKDNPKIAHTPSNSEAARLARACRTELMNAAVRSPAVMEETRPTSPEGVSRRARSVPARVCGPAIANAMLRAKFANAVTAVSPA
jgi:hypothetical protein